VKLGFAMEGNASVHMRVPALSLMRSVLNVSEVYGTMEAEYSVVLFAETFSVKMISLSTRPAAKF
jgi:hypothetical protein